MPDRIVRTGIITSEPVNSLSWGAEVFYRRLFSIVDDFGRHDGRTVVLRALLYTLKIDSVSDTDISGWLGECASAGLIIVYKVKQNQYIEIAKFGQRTRANKSKWPSPDDGERQSLDGDSLASADICQQVTSNALVCVVGDVCVDDIAEPNGSVVANAPQCPHTEIINLYHEILPSLTRVREWTAPRQALLRKRWNENPDRQSLAWWRDFFSFVQQSDFLMGRKASRGSDPFECDLEWLVRPNNIVKVIEGKYDNRGAA